MTTTRKVALILSMLISNPAHGIWVELNGVEREFKDGVRITGEIKEGSSAVIKTRLEGEKARGDYIVIINSQGGRCDEGETIYREIRKYGNGHRMICLVTGQAQSMGFNILSRCDERYGEANAVYMMHDPLNIYSAEKPDEDGKYEVYVSLKKHREDIEDLMKTARKYRESNRRALRWSRKKIDKTCDLGDTMFTAEELIENGYLKGLGRVLK